ncbi:50S ribosomal protein L16 [Coprothermobacteraceae bacterium]|nr:50S ribosomal protein L16 [Coprothermobacteraceae bacterium]
MLMPKRVKYRKNHLPHIKGKETRGTELAFGDYGIQAVGRGYIDARMIESCRVVIAKNIGKTGKYWIKIFPDRVWTKKPLEVRMGGGKGDPEKWIFPVRPGRILFEMTGIDGETARHIARLVGYRLPFETKLVSRV